MKDVDNVIAEFEYSVNKIKNDTSDAGLKTLVADPVFNKITPQVKPAVEKVKELSEGKKLWLSNIPV